MPGLFVTAVGTDIGKTHVAVALITELRRQGRPVGAFKPVVSGYDGLTGSDSGRLLEALGRPASDLDAITPLRFSAPLAPSSAARLEGQVIEHARLVRLCREKLDESGDAILIIEGAGGVMSPLAEGATNLDLMEGLGLPALLVTGSYLGAISHTLTALTALAQRGLTVAAIVVSESAGNHPPVGEITGGLAQFAPGIPVIVAPRDVAWDASPLAAALSL